MSRAVATGRLVLAGSVLLASLTFVAWRQSRALEALAALEEVRGHRELAEVERATLQRRIQHLESRGRVVPEAKERLGMHTPDASEIVFLAVEKP